MPKYQITLETPDEDTMSTVIAALKGQWVKSVEALENEPPVSPPQPPKARKKLTRKSPALGWGGMDLVRDIFFDRKEHEFAEVQERFKKEGFNPKSASARLSDMTKDGEIEQHPNGAYAATKRMKPVQNRPGVMK